MTKEIQKQIEMAKRVQYLWSLLRAHVKTGLKMIMIIDKK